MEKIQLLDRVLFGGDNRFLSISIAILLSVICAFSYRLLPVAVYITLTIVINYFIVRCLVQNKLGLIPCSLYLFIVTPGTLQLLFWYLSKRMVTVAILGNDYLTDEIVNFSASISTLTAASAIAGFVLSPTILNIRSVSIKKNDLSILFSFICFIVCAILYARSVGSSLLETGGYVSDGEDAKSSSIGTLNVFCFYFFSYFFIFKYWVHTHTKTAYYVYLTITLLTVGYIAIRGVRQDSIGFLLAIFAVVKSRKRIESGKSLYRFVLFLFLISWLGSLFTGLLREDFSITNLSAILQNPFLYFVMLAGNYVVFNMNTASMTIGTLNVIPYKIQESGYLYGQTFLDWIPRTLPEFLYADRPIGPEFEMHYNNEWFGWGGIHEAAEIFWNFGILGTLVVPFIISYCLNSLGKSFIRSSSVLSAIPLVWMIMMPRWSWYQLFALYKSTFVMLLLATMVMFLLLVKKAVPQKLHGGPSSINQ